MKSKRHKTAMVDADQPIRDLTKQRSSANVTSRDQKEATSTPAQRTAIHAGPVKEWTRLRAGDPDVSQQGLETGEEMPGGSTPTPDQDRVDEIGETVGITYQDNEPLNFGEKYAKRDEERWEDDPASSEDYGERQAALESVSSSPKKRAR